MLELPQTEEQVRANLDALFAIDPGRLAAREEQAAPISPGAGEASDEPAAECGDRLCELPAGLLVDFQKEKHPFRPYTREELEGLKEDIRCHGVLQPLLVRPHPTRRGCYEIISGHNRVAAAVELGYTTLPCIVRTMDDNEALLQMISSNLKQRTGLLPSEKAWAYRYELEAMNRQGIRRDLTLGYDETTSTQLVSKLRSNELVGAQSNESREQVRRYIRLTYLLPSLLERVDGGKLPRVVGETLSYLTPEGQGIVENFFFSQRTQPITQPMAARCRELEAEGALSEQALEAAFCSPLVIKQLSTVSIKLKRWKKYFPETATQQQVVDTIEAALREYFEKKEDNSG